MNKKTNLFGSLSGALRAIPTAKMDSDFENSVVDLLRKLDADSGWEIVRELLTDPCASKRALGLRVVRRQFREKKLLERVVFLSFSVNRLTELQHWYEAVLSRYPLRSFLRKLELEADNTKDPDFIARHIRALQMHRAVSGRSKAEAIEKLKARSSSDGFTSRS